MNKPQQAAAQAPERLTWAEICRQYPDEWVVLVETEWLDEDNFEFGKAVVLGHSNGHDEVLRKTKPLHAGFEEFGIYFTGRARPLPPGFLLP